LPLRQLEISVRTLDQEVRKRRPRSTDAAGEDFLPTVEPWPDAVAGDALLDDLAATITRHVGLPDGGADAVALWTVHTHLLDAAYRAPRLAITSPTRECGKSTLLTAGREARAQAPASFQYHVGVGSFERSKNGVRSC
jgi:hypothetical protein